MYRKYVLSILVLSLISGSFSFAAMPIQVDVGYKIFNGKTLDGWKGNPVYDWIVYTL